jgi:FkbM family methyltransferase
MVTAMADASAEGRGKAIATAVATLGTDPKSFSQPTAQATSNAEPPCALNQPLIKGGRTMTNFNNLIFDIGANNGDDTQAYLKRGCKVVAIEANPALCAALRERFSAEIDAGQLIVVDKAISRRSKVTLYVNSAESGWGTTLPGYAQRGLRMRGEIVPIEVETTTVIDLIRAHGVPNYIKVDIEGADVLCLLDLFDSDLPPHLSIERPKSLSDQLFALGLLRRLGYRRFAFRDQTTAGQQTHSASKFQRGDSGLFGDEISAVAWMGWASAWIKNAWLYGIWALGGIARRAPVLRVIAPGVRWFDIHAGK